MESIIADMARLGLATDHITYTSGTGGASHRRRFHSILPPGLTCTPPAAQGGCSSPSRAPPPPPPRADYFAQLFELGERMIKSGVLYADDTPVDEMRDQRMHGVESRCRGRSVEENLRIFKEMLAGSEEGERAREGRQQRGGKGSPTPCGLSSGASPAAAPRARRPPRCPATLPSHPAPPPPPPPPRNCIRIKMDMSAPNKALRDPVAFRCNDTHHWRTGDKYKVREGGR